MLELYGYKGSVNGGDTWRACHFAAFHARRQSHDEPIDSQDSYIYDYGGVRLYMKPDADAEGEILLTWTMWSTAAYGLGTFVARHHFDVEFQFMILQDWPRGQQVTQRYLGFGAVMTGDPRLNEAMKTGEKAGNATGVTA